MTLLRQTAIYGVVGLSVYAIDYSVFAALLAFSPASLVVANILGRLAGALAGYVLHGRYTFPGEHRHAAALPRYVLLLLANLCASSLLLLGAAAWLPLPTLIARLAVDALVIAASFLVSRAWVYARA